MAVAEDQEDTEVVDAAVDVAVVVAKDAPILVMEPVVIVEVVPL